MTLTPEDRQRIYEEEKARHEAQDRLKAEAGRKRNVGCLSVVGGLILLMILLSAVSSLMNSSDKSSTSAGSQGTSPQSPTFTKDDLLKKVGTMTDGLDEMKTGIAGESMDHIKLSLEVFNAAAILLQQLQSQTLTAEEQAKVVELRKSLVMRQRQALPVIRDKVGPIFSKELWMSDGKARTFGTRFTTVEFINGSFAANANIAKAHQAILAALTRMRFKRAQYRWYAEADEYSYYTIASPSDGDVAIIDTDGDVTPVPE